MKRKKCAFLQNKKFPLRTVSFIMSQHPLLSQPQTVAARGPQEQSKKGEPSPGSSAPPKPQKAQGGIAPFCTTRPDVYSPWCDGRSYQDCIASPQMCIWYGKV